MARFDEILGRPPFWLQQARYDGAAYDLSHLQPLNRTMITAKGEPIPLRFRFSYHCCTDKPGRRDLGTRIREESRPDEDRLFCPVRWFLSLRLPSLARALDATRLAPVPGYQWLHLERIPGISLPWAVWLKVMPGAPGGATVIGVESAYLAGAPPRGGQPEGFRFIVQQTRRLGSLMERHRKAETKKGLDQLTQPLRHRSSENRPNLPRDPQVPAQADWDAR